MGNNRSCKVSSGYHYVVGVGIASLILAATFFVLAELLARRLDSLTLSFVFLVVIILVGITFDLIGTAVAAASEAPFHAKAAKKVPGAQEGILLIRNADKVASITMDVVGDIAGTVSGALGISLVVMIVNMREDLDRFALNILMTAVIAALTVSGKAYGKRFALSRPNDIIFFVAKIMAWWRRLTGKSLNGKRKR